MDAFTLQHLDNWLARLTDSEEERAIIKAAMIKTADDDFAYWVDKGWVPLFDAAGGFSLIYA